MVDTKELIQDEVITILSLERKVQAIENELLENEVFARLVKAQRDVQAQITDFWTQVEAHMIEADMHELSGEWGRISIVNSPQTFDINKDELPAKYWKKVPDTTRVLAVYRLEGKPPKGATPRAVTKRLRKEIG